MQLTTSSLAAAVLAACVLVPSEAFLSAPLFAVPSKTTASPFSSSSSFSSSGLSMARSENSKRTSDRDRERRGGPQDFQYGGGDYDYSGGNLKYGTGKYTQRENDGYQGGVNISKNGRSMQDSVYREDRNNVDRARGRPGGGPGGGGYGSRMDEIEDMERGMGRSREGMRDRMMRNRDDEGFGPGGGGGMGMGIRDRMGGGGGLLRDMQGVGGRNHREGGHGGFDDFGLPPKVMGGSSKGRGGGYRSSQFESGLSNERRRYEEYGFRINDFMAERERDGIIDYERGMDSHNRRQRGGGRPSNFDRLMGRDNYDDYDDDHHDHHHRYEMEDYQRNGRRGGGRGGRNQYDDGFYEDYGDDRGRRGGGGGDGRLLRDMRR